MKRPSLVETLTANALLHEGGERRLRALFIAGAGTEIGKTYVTAALIRHLREKGRSVLALKPLASGVPPIDDPAFALSDTAILLTAQGLPITPETVASCSPWRFSAPLAPDQAAAREGRTLALDELVAWCDERLLSHPPHPEEPRIGLEGGFQGSRPRLEGPLEARLRLASQDEGEDGSIVLIEGVGGLMSPITDEATGLDWLKRLNLPALLVTGSYLGAISHALTAIETLKAHGVPLAGIVVSESVGAPTVPQTVAEAIARHVVAPVDVLRRGGGFPEDLLGMV